MDILRSTEELSNLPNIFHLVNGLECWKTMFLTPLAPQNTGKQQSNVASDAIYLLCFTCDNFVG